MRLNIASYHAPYVLCLVAALAVTTARGQTHVRLLVVSVLFIAFSIAMTTGIPLLSCRDVDRVTAKLQRIPALRNTVDFLKDADPHLTRNPPLPGEAVGRQTTIFLLDAATIRTEPGARARAPHAHAGTGESDPAL
jgi:hypothetical protein